MSRRAAKPKHAGGRPPLPDSERRQLVAARLLPVRIAQLDRLTTRYGTRTDVIDHAIEQLAIDAGLDYGPT